MNSYDATDEFYKHLEARKTLEDFRRADIDAALCVKNKGGAILQLNFKQGLCQFLDVGTEFTIVPNPELILSAGRGQSISRAVFGNVGNTDTKKLVLEVDLTTGHSTLRMV